ncbi:MAG: rhodanese-like domain-containing protein [Burkholderiales bacterium]|jgi:rhodanese-related sulfurtransferase|nr:rhodanese-like domain-containing protein [Burkholderiales bacterium]
MSYVAFLEKNWMMALVFVVSGVMLIVPFVTRRMSKARDVGNLEATVLMNKKDAIIVDVRETSEYENGRLPGAVHIPLSQLDARVAEIARQGSRPVIAYCARGNRSRMAASALSKAGFGEIYNLSGGIDAWRSAGLPVEK